MASLWHRWCSTLCSKRTLPNALLGPRPPDQTRTTNEIQYQSQGATNQVQVAWPVHSIITNAALLPSRPPLPNIWDSSQESLGSPDQLQRYQCNSIELTNAHSDPDVWQVAAHSCTFGADGQPTVPVCARYETLQTNLKIN